MLAIRPVVFLAVMVFVSYSHAMDCSYFGLLEHLNLTEKSDFLASVPPIKTWTEPMTVLVDLLILGILDVNEKSQTVTLHASSPMGWTNEFLRWNPEEFCGIARVLFPRQKLWSPDIHIAQDVSDAGAQSRSPYVQVFANGFVHGTEYRRLTTTCLMNLVKFPFDIQTCTIVFRSFILPGDSLTLGTFSSSGMITNLSETFMVTKGEWELIRIISNVGYDNSPHNSSYLVYEVRIRRRPMLYIMNFIMPLFCLLVLDVASFFISNSAGEKLSFKVTILLSTSVLLLILQDILPSTADNVPLIVIYCIVDYLMVCLSVLESILVCYLLSLDSSANEDTEGSVKACEEIQKEDTMRGLEMDQDIGEKKSMDSEQHHETNLLRLILGEVIAARGEYFRIKTLKEGKKRSGNYKKVARYFDLVFFIIYICCIFSFLLLIYLDWFEEEDGK